MENVELHCDDCEKVLPRLAGKRIAVISDPPYGIGDIWQGGSSHGWSKARNDGVERNQWDTEPPSQEVLQMILSLGEKVCLWGGNYFQLPSSRGWLIWVKPERNFTLSEAELAWTNIDMPMRVFDHRRSDPDRWHPTQKPISLMRWSILQLKLDKQTIIVDPYMGSGTTGAAAIELGYKFIGIEINERYFSLAKKRILQTARQPSLLELGQPNTACTPTKGVAPSNEDVQKESK